MRITVARGSRDLIPFGGLVQYLNITLGVSWSNGFIEKPGERTAIDVQAVRHRRWHASIRYLCDNADREPPWCRYREHDPAGDTRGQ
jgi:hypothetical protein